MKKKDKIILAISLGLAFLQILSWSNYFNDPIESSEIIGAAIFIPISFFTMEVFVATFKDIKKMNKSEK